MTKEKTILDPKHHPSSPTYIPSYEEEDAPTLVDSLVLKPTTRGRKDTDMTRGDKTTEDRRDLIKIKDEEEELEWIGIQTILIRLIKNIIENLIESIISNLVYHMSKSVNFVS